MENSMQNTYEVKMKKLPKSQREISATIPAAEFDATRAEALKYIGADAEIHGFRKGHVPEKMLVAKIGEGAVLEEMAEIAISRAYPKIIIGEKIDALGRPEVRITKIAMGNPLEFTLVTAVFPEITLPDYKKLARKEASKKEDMVITDEDVQKTIEQIQRMRREQETEHDHHEEEAANDGDQVREKKVAKDTPLPPFDDAYVRSLGDFDSVDAFKTKLRKNMLKEKERSAQDKKRVAIMEAIVADSLIDLPEIIVEQELHRMGDEFTHEVKRMGMTLDTYLAAVKKTREDMEKDWRPDAETRAKVQLVTSKIAETEDIEPNKDDMKREAAALRERYPEAEEERIDSYLEMLLTNEQVLQFLEAQVD